MSKKTLVIGASENESRYAAKAINMLKLRDHPIIALGKRDGSVHDIHIETELRSFEDIDTITLYINPVIQQQYYDYIIGLEPKRVIFNPGTENMAFAQMLKDKGIEVSIACTLVMLSTGQY